MLTACPDTAMNPGRNCPEILVTLGIHVIEDIMFRKLLFLSVWESEAELVNWR